MLISLARPPSHSPPSPTPAFFHVLVSHSWVNLFTSFWPDTDLRPLIINCAGCLTSSGVSSSDERIELTDLTCSLPSLSVCTSLDLVFYTLPKSLVLISSALIMSVCTQSLLDCPPRSNTQIPPWRRNSSLVCWPPWELACFLVPESQREFTPVLQHSNRVG